MTIEGRLTADPELRFTPNGKAICSFTVACNDRKKNGDQWEDGPPTFFRVTVWEKYGENVAESLVKGDAVLVVGKMSQRDYQNKDGEKRTSYQEVTADQVAPTLQWRTIPPGVGKASRGSTTSTPAAESGADQWGSDEPPY